MGRVGSLQLRMVTTGTAVCLALGVGACGGSTPTTVPNSLASLGTGPPGPPATNLPTDLQLPSPSAFPTASGQATASPTASADPFSKSIIPANFPYPPGSTPTLTVSKPTDASVSLKGVTPAAAVQFYRQALPGVGYKFFQQSVSDGRTKLTFSGRGQSVEILAGGTSNPQLVLVLFTACTSVVSPGMPTRRTDSVACQ